LAIFCPKNRTNEINSPKFAKGKYLWNVFKNRSNEIRTNEIRIRREPSVFEKGGGIRAAYFEYLQVMFQKFHM
jgi:hypothetical protein